MDVEDKKMLQYLIGYAVITAIAVGSIAYLCSRPKPTNDGDDACNYAERIESGVDRAAGAIGDGSGRIDAAEKALDRADAAIDRGQKAAADNSERIDRLQSIIDGCVQRNQQATELVKKLKVTDSQGRK